MPFVRDDFQKGTPVRPATKLVHGPQPRHERARHDDFGRASQKSSIVRFALLSLEMWRSQARSPGAFSRKPGRREK